MVSARVCMNNGTTKKRVPGLGDRVRELRTRKALTLQVAATRGATTPQTWIQAERFDLATARTLNNIARVLGVDVDTLVGRKPVPSAAAVAS